jgi:predicted AlkP superfamily phosphohydrolase/phosphomutase
LVPLANKLGVRDLAEQIVPQQLINRIPNAQGQLNREQKSNTVDWENSAAVASGQGPIYLIRNQDDPEYESLRQEIRLKLQKVKTPDGNQVVSNIFDGEEVYSGEYATERPDLVAEQADNVHIPGGSGHEDVFTEAGHAPWTAENKQNGLFIATGPDFANGTIEDISIIDLAPTLLHLHGCPIPRDMDGSVKKSVFDEGSVPHSTSVTQSDRTTKADEIVRIREAVSRITF